MMRSKRVDHCTLDDHAGPVVMVRRYGNVGGEFGQLFVCLVHDGDAADPDKINPSFGRKRCANRACLRRWEHPGDCP